MAPRVAPDHVADRPLVHAERRSDDPMEHALHGQGSDSPNGAVVESGGWVVGALLIADRWAEHAATLRDPVVHVVRLRAEEQMLGANTGRVVAAMEDVQANGDRSMGEFVGNSVSSATTFTIPHEETVAAPRAGSLPDQTVADWFRSAPQSGWIVPNSHERMIPCH